MKRDLSQLSGTKFDVLVVGGGIYGACVAWDAALRGLSVAMIEKIDFGHATSANSLKIIHGGLRYLQDINFKRVRSMAIERTTWLRIAPHLVHPLACLTPTYRDIKKNKLVLATALSLNDLISYDRNRSVDPFNHLPKSRVVSKDECLHLLNSQVFKGITGGAIWHDAQIYNSERLLLSFVLSASEAGAEVANYVEATGFIRDDMGIQGVIAKDVLTGQDFEIQADIVINCAGAWVDALLELSGSGNQPPKFNQSVAVNLVTHKIISDYTLGLSGTYHVNGGDSNQTEGSQMLFFVPWRGYTIIGTKHVNCSQSVQDYRIPEETIAEFINEINTAYPAADLRLADVLHIHWGFLPTSPGRKVGGRVKLLRDSQIHDHQIEDGIKGLITIIGVKYTTARVTAQEVVDLVVKKLGRKTPPCRTHVVPVFGGAINRFGDLLFQAKSQPTGGISPEVIEHLVYTYGSAYPHVLAYLEEQPTFGARVVDGYPIIKAEVINAVRNEMAQKLGDVIQRRTEIGAFGLPKKGDLLLFAEIMSSELGWSNEQKELEVGDVVSSYLIA